MACILLIDDDEQMRRVIRLVLEKEGHTVLEASDGRRGAAIFREFWQDGVDLVITDIIMPEKEGIETISELKEIDPNVKIIAMSGGGRTRNLDFLKIAEKLGAQRSLAKPFRPHELLETVRDVLGAAA